MIWILWAIVIAAGGIGWLIFRDSSPYDAGSASVGMLVMVIAGVGAVVLVIVQLTLWLS